MKEYDKLVFRIQQWPEGMKKEITADFTEDTVIVRIPAAGILKRRRYTHIEMRKLFNQLQTCHPENWTECYDSPVLDGTVWQLQLFCGLRNVCESCGNNRFPAGWKNFSGKIHDFLKIA